VLADHIFGALHLRHHLHGPAADYVGVGAAAAASWAGIPGPGEAALITAAIVAAHHHLDILEAIAVAWLGAAAGGTAGWLVGLKAGRAVVSAPGPLRRGRIAALGRGDRFFERFGLVAVFFTPSWVAGIHGMRAGRFLPANVVASFVWAAAIGAGAYYAGPPVVEVVDDVGLVTAVIVGAVVAAAVVGGLAARARARRRR
jgi:membrane protein DedA with SNARE-associated domain